MTMLRIQRIPWALSGVFFVALFGLGFIFANVLAPDPYPSPFGPPFGPSTDIARYFTNSRFQVQMMSFLYSLAAIMLLIFSVHVAAFVRQSGDATSVLSRLTLGGGIMAAVFTQLSALFLWVLARPVTVEEPALLGALHELAYLTGGPAHVLSFAPFIGASSITMWHRPVLARWLTWVGIAASVLSLLSVFALLWEPATLILPLGRVLAFVWIFTISVMLTLGRPSEAASRRQTSPRPVS